MSRTPADLHEGPAGSRGFLTADPLGRWTLLWRVLCKACPNCGGRRHHRNDCVTTYAHEMATFSRSN